MRRLLVIAVAVLVVGGATAAGAASDFEITEVRAQRTKDGRPQITADVKNTGDGALHLSGELALFGPDGSPSGPYPMRVASLAAHASDQVVFGLARGLDPGPWKVRVTVTAGSVERTRTATLTFPGAGQSAGEQPKNSALSNVIGIVVFAAIAIGFFRLFFGRRRREGHASSD